MPTRVRRHVLHESSIFDKKFRFKRYTRYMRWPYNPVDNCCLRRCTLDYIRKNFCATPVNSQIDDVVRDVNSLTERTRRHIRTSINRSNLTPGIFLLHRNNNN